MMVKYFLIVHLDPSCEYGIMDKNRFPKTKSQIEDNDNTFIDLRDTLFNELTKDVIVEIADLHIIPSELVLKKYPAITDENHEIESKFGNSERLLALLENVIPCCKKNCFQNFNKNDLFKFAQSLDNCSKNEAETALLMNMREHEGEVDITKRGDLRKRQRVMYSVKPFGEMCREAYLRLWGIGERTLRNLRSYQKLYPGTFAPRIHGNTNKSPSNTINSSVHKSIVKFINTIGKEAGEESEGRNSSRNNHAVKFGVVRFLPAYYSIALLYRLFLARYQEKHGHFDTAPLSIRQFYYIFNSHECALNDNYNYPPTTITNNHSGLR